MDELNGRINNDSEHLYGTISPIGALSGKISSQGTLRGEVLISHTIYIHDRLPDYEGEYNVIPKVDEQILETKDKSMLDDVTIEAVPYQEVPNEHGITVSICS